MEGNRFCGRLADCELDGAVPADLHAVQDVLRAIERTRERLRLLRIERAEASRATAMRAETETQVPGQTVIFSPFAQPAALAS